MWERCPSVIGFRCVIIKCVDLLRTREIGVRCPAYGVVEHAAHCAPLERGDLGALPPIDMSILWIEEMDCEGHFQPSLLQILHSSPFSFSHPPVFCFAPLPSFQSSIPPVPSLCSQGIGGLHPPHAPSGIDACQQRGKERHREGEGEL